MYLKITNGQPEKYSLIQLRQDNPNTSFPDTPPEQLLASYDVYRYTVQDTTYDSLIQRKVEGQFTQVEGQWVLPMVAENLPLDQAEASIRRERNSRIYSCDWTQLSDSPLPEATKTAWATYRQELRDITVQVGFPYSVIWPTPPE